MTKIFLIIIVFLILGFVVLEISLAINSSRITRIEEAEKLKKEITKISDKSNL